MKPQRLILVCALTAVLTAPCVQAQGHGDIVHITNADSTQGWPQVCHDPNGDRYLSVWEDQRNGRSNTDIYGQLVDGDGTLIGGNFPICTAEGAQYWPHLDFDPGSNRYLVVFEDQRKGFRNGDIRGVFVSSTGALMDAPTSDADHSFEICSHDSSVYTCSVAFNHKESVYLVVWGDFRNDTSGQPWSIGVDVYGQLVRADGTLTAPADPKVNFPVFSIPEFEESVADVTYNSVTNEFFAVCGTGNGMVFGQRVDHLGRLVNPDGTKVLGKAAGSEYGILVAYGFMNGPDCLQVKTQSRTENTGALPKPAAVNTEVQVIWKGMLPPLIDNDVYGQRIRFSLEGQVYAAEYLDRNGWETDGPSNFPISIQPDFVGVPDIAYGSLDDEYLVGWGDPRKGGFADNDLYVQRLWIDDLEGMKLLADNRVDTVSHFANSPVDTTDRYEGSLLGVAHRPSKNEFLLVYTFQNLSGSTGSDIYARRFFGTEVPVSAVGDETAPAPGSFDLSQNYPNPFNAGTVIAYRVREPGRVVLKIHDVQGREIETLFDGVQEAGSYRIPWNGKGTPSGVYFYTLRTGGIQTVKKMAVIR
jgi:hypothetical protein